MDAQIYRTIPLIDKLYFILFSSNILAFDIIDKFYFDHLVLFMHKEKYSYMISYWILLTIFIFIISNFYNSYLYLSKIIGKDAKRKW